MTGWERVRIRDFCEARLGKMLDRKRETGTRSRPYLRNVSVRWGHFDLSNLQEMDFDDTERQELRLRPGDVLVCEGGEVGRAAVWQGELEECYFQKALHRLRPDPARCLPEFLQRMLELLARTGGLNEYTSHSTIAHLTGVKLGSIAIPLPNLLEQRRIVDILDRATSIRRLRRQAQETARQIVPAVFNKMFGDPGTNPMGWPTVQMQSVFREKPRYGTMAPATAEPKEYLCIRVANIQDNRLSLESMKFVSSDAINEQRHLVEDGDLLVARAIASRDLLGKCFVAYPGNRRWAFDSHVMMCRFDDALADPEYVSSFLKSPSGRREFLSHTRNSAIQFNINTKEFSAITLPLPPIELQARFVGRAKEIIRIAERQSSADTICEFASQAIIARLFG